MEVTEGREERRDQLIRAGYTWVNRPKPPESGRTSGPVEERQRRQPEQAQGDDEE
ncbi:MAG: hypothetical protein IT323_22690 [Anaerolineae bacterium]|nr:hypothetical protein [Anaerolineae bacterium]